MSNETFVRVLDDKSSEMVSEITIKDLTRPNITEYERGIYAGKISMLGELKMAMLPDEIEKINEKVIGTGNRIKYEKS